MACEGLRRAAIIAEGLRDDSGVLGLTSWSLFWRCCCCCGRPSFITTIGGCRKGNVSLLSEEEGEDGGLELILLFKFIVFVRF